MPAGGKNRVAHALVACCVETPLDALAPRTLQLDFMESWADKVDFAAWQYVRIERGFKESFIGFDGAEGRQPDLRRRNANPWS